MDLTHHTFEELSGLKFQIHTYPFIKQAPPETLRVRSEILIVSFKGEYGIGSGGNADARFMFAIVTAALSAWWSRGLIVDLREMSYEWGDAILDILNVGKIRYTFAPFPTVVVTSSLNDKALRSLLNYERQNPQEWLFASLEEALAAVEFKEEANQRLTN